MAGDLLGILGAMVAGGLLARTLLALTWDIFADWCLRTDSGLSAIECIWLTVGDLDDDNWPREPWAAAARPIFGQPIRQ